MPQKKPKKPTSPKMPESFIHEGQPWTITYHDINWNGNLGETVYRNNEIKIWVKDTPLCNIQETLQHELLHLSMRDLTTILSGSASDSHDQEEAIIRIASPRLFALLTLNPQLKEFIYGK
jgi:hypothetical protein